MIIRALDGTIEIIKRIDYKNDIVYFTKIYDIIKPFTEKYNNFFISKQKKINNLFMQKTLNNN